MTRWPFGDLRMFGYRALMVDPAWHYEMYSAAGEAKSPQAHYATMSDADILGLPVGDLAAGDGAVLFLWAVWPKIELASACIRRWGFAPVTGGSWVKTTLDGTGLRLGTGYTFRSACEPFLVARIGRPQARLTDVPNVILAPPREHSRKPDEARVIVERMSPGAARAELFARCTAPGWDVWGNETDRFQQPVAEPHIRAEDTHVRAS